MANLHHARYVHQHNNKGAAKVARTRHGIRGVERLVRDEAARMLAEKGYREMAAAEADFALTYGAAVSISYRTDPRTGETLRGATPDWVPSYTVREGTRVLVRERALLLARAAACGGEARRRA